MIASKIESIRREKNITQQELAKKIGLTLSGYQKAIATDDFKISMLKKITDILDIPISYFFENSENHYFLSEFFRLKNRNYRKNNIHDFIKSFVYYSYDVFLYDNKEIKELIENTLEHPYIQFKKGYTSEYKEELSAYPGGYDNEEIGIVGSFIKRWVPLKGNDDVKKKLHEILPEVNKRFSERIHNSKAIKWLIDEEIISVSDVSMFLVNAFDKP